MLWLSILLEEKTSFFYEQIFFLSMSIPTSGGISESDAAFYSFACVMMCIYLVPASLFSSYRIWKKPKKAFTPAFSLHVLALAMLMYAVWYCFQQLQNVDTFGVFDPYEILKISDSSSLSEIKKAYRKMSKRLHPDKNRHNPHATAQFARIVKAYEALTDPMGIENYRKYGHPDGKQSLLMNVAFFSFPSGSSGSGGFFVLIYFALMIGFILWIVFYVIKSGKRKDKSQVSRKTLQSFADILNERMSVLDILELLLSCDEMTFAEDHELLEIQQREKTHLKLLKKMSAAKALPGEVTNRIKDTINPVARYGIVFYKT
jgi:preprotein translocase subunit Sec63